MGLLNGDTALVTGAASGIGRGIARAIAAEGARLVVSDLPGEAGEALAREIGAVFVAADLSDRAGAARLFEGALAELGSVSVLVHSACPKRREEQTVLAATESQWDEMIDVGLRSGFVLGQAAAAHMIGRRIHGRMLFITSLHAYTPRNLPHYSASKAGQTMLVREFARALGRHGIRVNAIAPGAVLGGGFQGDEASLAAAIPLGRTGRPDDVAGMALALLSDRFSRYVTGATVDVDGGLALYNWIPPASPAG